MTDDPAAASVVIECYDDLIAGMRARRISLGYSCETLDAIAGFADIRYAQRIENPKTSYGRMLGDLSFACFMEALGLRLLLVSDPNFKPRASAQVSHTNRRRTIPGASAEVVAIHAPTA